MKMSCSECGRPYDKGQPILLWRRYPGEVLDLEKKEDGTYRYYVRYTYPTNSEELCRTDWVVSQEIIAA